MREDRTKGRGRGGRKKGRHFMDVAVDGYVRDLALEKWREVDDLISTLGMSLGEAVKDAGSFPSRERYHELWQVWWGREVSGHADLAPEQLMERIEAAMREALNAEAARRAEEGEPGIEDTPHYVTFVGRTMDRLLEDGEGEVENFDEEEL